MKATNKFYQKSNLIEQQDRHWVVKLTNDTNVSVNYRAKHLCKTQTVHSMVPTLISTKMLLTELSTCFIHLYVLPSSLSIIYHSSPVVHVLPSPIKRFLHLNYLTRKRISTMVLTVTELTAQHVAPLLSNRVIPTYRGVKTWNYLEYWKFFHGFCNGL